MINDHIYVFRKNDQKGALWTIKRMPEDTIIEYARTPKEAVRIARMAADLYAIPPLPIKTDSSLVNYGL